MTNDDDFSRMSIQDLESKIAEHEKELEALRGAYFKKKGQLPPRPSKDSGWRWLVFMMMGFAFLTSMFYLFNVHLRHSSNSVEYFEKLRASFIPEFFLDTDFALYAILTFFVVIMVLTISPRIKGHQAWAYILGFWCSYWIFYDWPWHAIKIGTGIKPGGSEFWWDEFGGYHLLMPNPYMWVFLVLAIVGFCIAIYMFTMPRNHVQLLPAALWLYATYANVEILRMTGLDDLYIVIIGVSIAGFACFLALYFTIVNYKKNKEQWKAKLDSLKQMVKERRWSKDPLGFPWVFIFIGSLALMYVFLVAVPVVGLFLGTIPWYLFPFARVLYYSSSTGRLKTWGKIIVVVIIGGFLVGLLFLIEILA
ncbi:MAG: hypothetical protein ACFFCS_06595 [Candidatus Hodarchaeota archaeon]